MSRLVSLADKKKYTALIILRQEFFWFFLKINLKKPGNTAKNEGLCKKKGIKDNFYSI